MQPDTNFAAGGEKSVESRCNKAAPGHRTRKKMLKRRWIIRGLRFLLVAAFVCATLLSLLTFLWITLAASRSWTGASINNPNPALRNNFWSNSANWGSNVAPVAGDDLVFPTALQATS